MSSTSDIATVISILGKQPTLIPGPLLPATLTNYERACRNYFNAKDIAAKKQVAVIVGGLQDVHIIDWLTPEEESTRVAALKFKDFMSELRARFLDKDCELKAQTDLLKCHMRTDKTFVEYHTCIVKIHSLLTGTASALDPTRLQHTIEAGLVPDLLRRLDQSNKVKAAKTLQDWIAIVKDLDEDCQNHIATIQAQMELQRKVEKHKAETDGGNKSKKMSYDALHMSTPLSNSASSSNHHLPPLSDTEKELLRAHKGCLKCSIPYVDHISKNCPTGFPNANTYVPITKAACLTAKGGSTTAAPVATAPKTPTVAVVMRTIDAIEDSDDSTMGDDLSVSSSLPHSPHRAEHLYWECLADGPLPSLLS
ncbi:hypothetical protein C8R43DRAFT_879695 [Mycena crocata]|nr:hypothetical protein C8R43DRAFT_879695 [Mycena crocata]